MGRERIGKEKREKKNENREGKGEYGPVKFVVLKVEYGGKAVAGYESAGHVVRGVEALDVV